MCCWTKYQRCRTLWHVRRPPRTRMPQPKRTRKRPYVEPFSLPPTLIIFFDTSAIWAPRFRPNPAALESTARPQRNSETAQRKPGRRRREDYLEERTGPEPSNLPKSPTG